jgi:phosphohistidine phosphatase
MRIVVVRHGIAGDRESVARTGRPPEERPLTAEGRARMAQVASGLRRLVDPLDALVTSPLVRARETAELIVEAFGGPKPVIEDALSPGGEPAAVVAALRELDPDATVALVGHEPDLSRLVGFFVTGAAASVIDLKKGAACLVRFDGVPAAGGGMIVWALPPKALRRLAEADV